MPLLLLAACGAHAGVPAPAPAIDAVAASALRDGDAVGISIVVARGDPLVHARGYGYADRERRIAATEHSIYPLASLSKQLWAVAALQLVEAGRVDLEAPLATILYTFPDHRIR